MEQSLDDLLNGAFSEVSVGLSESYDLDLPFEDMFEEDVSQENLPTNEDETLHQEAAGEAKVLSNTENKDMYLAENADEAQSDDKSDDEDFRGVGVSVMSMDKTPQEDFTSSDTGSEEGSSESGDDGEEADAGTAEKPGDLLMSVCCSDEFSYGAKESELFAVGQPLALEGTEPHEVGNEEQGESEMDEELCYFGQVPEQAKELMIKGDGSEEDEQERQVKTQEESSDSDSEPVKIQQEENVLALCSEQEVESPYRVEASLSEISGQHEQHLSVEVYTEKYVEKLKDFSGEEHQEAGETFAEYPSDFSSCEYVEGRRENSETDYKAKSLSCLETAATDITWMGKEEDADQEGEDHLYSRGLEMATDEDGKTIEIIEHGCDDEDQVAESDSYSSSDDDDDDDVHGRRDEELLYNTHLLDSESYEKLELYSESDAAVSQPSISDDHHFMNNQGNLANFNVNWDFNFGSLLFEDLLTTVDTDSDETQATDMSVHVAEDTSSYSVVQRDDSKTTHMPYQGSLDDSFFFNTEHVASGVSDLGQLGDDEYEEERNWEQEKERIEAFYKFYDDGTEENGREERQIKVQFCTDPLSQVIHYETDSSDRDSLSSSTEGEDDLSSAETSEEPREPDDTLQLVRDPPDIELPDRTQENDVSSTQICTRKHKCWAILKQILKMGLVLLMGTLMFWLATEQADYFEQFFFF